MRAYAKARNINYDGDGSYDFKGVYCSIAGKNIAMHFMAQSDGYTIRFTRTDPRSGGDAPDEFEAEGLSLFEGGAAEHYGLSRDEESGEQEFCYMRVLTITGGCLSCHGEPAGDTDETASSRREWHSAASPGP